MAAAAFEPVAYKRDIFEQWELGAAPWDRWRPTIEAWLGEATELMLDLVEVREGDRILDIAAGTGGQTLAAAKRVGPSGLVVATDVSPTSLRYTADAAARAGFKNVLTRTMDGERLEVEPGSFDAVISRIGFTYFPDERAAFGGMVRALRPQGRIGGIVYSTPERNPCFSVPISVIRRRAGIPPPPSGQPGPFSLGDAGSLKLVLLGAGFKEVVVRAVDATIRTASASECVRFERESLIGLTRLLSGLSPEEQDDVWAEIHGALAAFEEPDGFRGPSQLLVVAGAT